ncbi:MAG: hypothetical protein KAY32_11530 [Candidatus Eisenbacteria sp.]|nr:hypothetical protein [Candidatus Eisenbacteria bacterium]
MPDEDALVQNLQSATGLDEAVLRKIVQEIREWYDEDLPAWVQRRHRELQRQGAPNREIFSMLCQEARRILIRPRPMTERQIRRLIYG